MRNSYGFPEQEKPNIKLEVRDAMSRARLIPWIVAIIGLVIFVCAVWVNKVRAEDYSNDVIANAIFKAENSVKYPYGIKSIDTHGDKEYARKICLNTIRNHRKRHAKHECGLDFITCLGMRYCPPEAHSLNRNWVSNVKKFLRRG